MTDRNETAGTLAPSICVYCGASSRGPESHRAVARAFGRGLAEHSMRLVYGGGHVGVMGALADAALAAGGEVIGVIPRFLKSLEVGHAGITRLEVVETMHERKARMAALSDGFAVLPGGLGTLEELFEIVTWRQLALHDKPIVVVDPDGYWAGLRAMIDDVIAAGYARPDAARLARFVGGVEEALDLLVDLPTGGTRLATERL